MTLCTLLHGAGSTPEFVERAFGPVLRAHSVMLHAPDVRGATVDEMVALLIAEPAQVVGGVSLGAHAAGAYASATGHEGGLYAVMPAWCGPPGSIAALTSHTADLIESTSVGQVLAGIGEPAGDDWVLSELRTAWERAEPRRLVGDLRVAAAQPAPTARELADIRAVTEVVALAGDPTHPEDVARVWADAIPGAHLSVLPRDLDGAGAIGLAGPLAGLLTRLSGSR